MTTPFHGEPNPVVTAYKQNYILTRSSPAAQFAAEEAFRELHPEIIDQSIVSSRAAIIISRAIAADPENFWHSAGAKLG